MNTQRKQKKSESRDVYARIATRDACIARREEALAEIGDASGRVHSSQVEVFDARNAVESFIRSHGGDERELDSWEKERLERLREKETSADARLEQDRARYEALTKEIAELDETIKAARRGTTQSDIERHDNELREVQKEIARLETLINEKRSQIDATASDVAPPADRKSEREDLLARVAIGEASQADIDALDKTIADERAAYLDAKQTIGPARDKAASEIAGLQRRLDTAKSELRTLNEKTPEVVFQFIIGDAEKLAADYLKHAKACRALWLQLLSLDRIARNLTGDQKMRRNGVFLSLSSNDIRIPTFSLEAFRGVPESELYFIADSNRDGNAALSSAIEQEAARLRLMGIEI